MSNLLSFFVPSLTFFHLLFQCLPESWIFCVELQLAVVFTFVIGIMTSLKKRGSEMIGWLLLALIVVVGFVVNAVEVYVHDLPPTWLWTLPDPA